MTKSKPNAKSSRAGNPRPFQSAPHSASATPKSAAARAGDQAAAADNLERRRYVKLKQVVYAYEGAPTSRIFLIRQKGEWFRFVGQSAVIFHYAIAPRINYKSRLYVDKDYEFAMPGGVVNVRDAEMLCQILVKHHYNLIKRDQDYYVFNAGKRYSLADLNAMMERKDKEWQGVNKIFLPKDVFPSLFTLLRELLLMTYNVVRKMEGYAREMVGDAIVEKEVGLVREYTLACNGVGLKESGYLEKVSTDMDWIKAQLNSLSIIQEIQPEKLGRLGLTIEKVKREVATCQPREV